MKVVEKFVSINGEGKRAGELAVFIRFKGCNLACSYCDTTWANEPGCEYEEMSPEEIASYIKETGVRNVTLTGGEPLLQKDISELIDEIFKLEGSRVEIETNGSVDIETVKTSKRPDFTLDYKLPSSGCEYKMNLNNYKQVKANDTVKFVVGNRQDLDKAKDIIEEYNLAEKCNVYLSPVFGLIEPKEIVEYMIDNKMNNVRLQIQMHKVIWNPNERGV